LVIAQSNVPLTDDPRPVPSPPPTPAPETRYRYPSDPDGMVVFAGTAGGSVLVSNHENSDREAAAVPPPWPSPERGGETARRRQHPAE
jgi:hypothetical protein